MLGIRIFFKQGEKSFRGSIGTLRESTKKSFVRALFYVYCYYQVFLYILASISEGLQALDTMVCTGCCATLDNIVTYLFKKYTQKGKGNFIFYITGILRDKTMDDKLIYIPNVNEQNYWLKSLHTNNLEPINPGVRDTIVAVINH